MKKELLATRLQDIFEMAYEGNQPFATREECVKDIFDNLYDANYLGLTLTALDEIRREYHIDIDKNEFQQIYNSVLGIQNMNLKFVEENGETCCVIDDIWYDICVNGWDIADAVEKYSQTYHFSEEEQEYLIFVLEKRQKNCDEAFETE